jgi:hypothetical protein
VYDIGHMSHSCYREVVADDLRIGETSEESAKKVEM